MSTCLAIFWKDRLARVVPLAGSTWTVGAGDKNDLVLAHPGVTDVHLRFHETKSGWEVECLDTARVNGVTAASHRLEPGDVIQIGELALHFTVEEGPESEEAAARTDDRTSRRRMKRLFEATGTLEAGSAEQVLSQALRELKSVFSVERGLVLLRAEHSDELIPVLVDGRADPLAAEFSMSVARFVYTNGLPAYIPDTSRDARFRGTESILDHEIRTVLCSPISWRNTRLGVLYLHGRSPSRPFGAEDLASLELFCRHAARALREGSDRQALLRQATQYRQLVHELGSGAPKLGSIPSASPAMRECLDLIGSAAEQDVGVLLTGESGVGKEVLAHAIHHASPRRGGPFVPVNLAALPRELVESELFGHEKGAFSGAQEARTGRLELAESGTLFLDEIGEIEPALQVKLLRVLQDKRFERLGGERTMEADVRFVFATNADLREKVRQGTFRSDLFYRLAAFPVRVPPLRERREDIPPLAEYFLADCVVRFRKSVRGMDPDAMDRLVSYDWPGNVRELRNVIERASILETGERLRLVTLNRGLGEMDVSAAAPAAAPAGDGFEAYPPTYELARAEFERRWLTFQLRRFEGNISETARQIGLSRVSIHKKITDLGIKS